MVRPGRPYWKGALRLSLVSIPVEIFNAVENGETVSFNQIHRPTGKRVKYSKTVPGIGEINSEDIAKGYAVGQDTYVLIEPEELEAIRLESKRTIELSCFVDRPRSIRATLRSPITCYRPTTMPPRAIW